MGALLTTERKRRLREALDTDWTRTVARLMTRMVIGIELAVIRVSDVMRPEVDMLGVGQLTAVIKTFERPRELRRLVRSIKRLYPDVAIVVADDSRRPSIIDGVETIHLPFSSGVSAGRNAALRCVKTPYFLLLDDDFVFTRETRLAEPLSVMELTPKIDILGGVVVNLPDFSTTDYSTAGLFPTSRLPLFEPGSMVGGLPVRLKVPNFYVGRTDKVREVGWTDELKFVDHLDFFTRACGRLTSVQDERLVALHARNPFDRSSPERKANVEESWAVLNRRYGRGSDG